MRHLTVSTLMTVDPVTVREDTPFHDIASALADRRISAVPVVDADHRVLGVVSEADLLPKLEFAEDAEEGAGFFEPRGHRLARRKATGLVARDLMTSPAVTVPASSTIVAAARLLESSAVKRLPVVDDLGRLVGIVTRTDLLKIYLRADAELRDEIVNEVLRRVLWIAPSEVRVHVHGGIVTLDGEVEQRSLVELMVHLVHAVDGVVDVRDDGVAWRTDDRFASDARYYRPLV